MLKLSAVLRLARLHVGDNPPFETSARLCLADAIALQDRGFLACARERAKTSLAYSVGVYSPVYARVR